jgi:uncharacterized protein (DUF2461 family)
MEISFEGFSEETVAFLLDLKENNDQGWFNEIRDRSIVDKKDCFLYISNLLMERE